jgi:hypothetical protein
MPEWVPWVFAVLLVILVVGGVAVVLSLKASYDQGKQQEGRRQAIEALCGIDEVHVRQIQLLIVGGTLLPGKDPRYADRLEGVKPVDIPRVLLDQPVKTVVELYRPGRFAKTLEGNGYPSFQQRLTAARLSAAVYEQRIGNEIARVARQDTRNTKGDKGDVKDLDCRKIVRIGRATG